MISVSASTYFALSTDLKTIDYFLFETYTILLASMMPNTPGFCSVSLANVLPSPRPLRFAPTQGSFLCCLVSSLRQSLLRPGFC